MSRHSSITQDWMGWNVGLFPRACHHPCSGTWGYHFPLETSLYIPHTEKAEFCLCYLIISMRSQLLPMVRFSRDSGNFCVQVIGMQNEMNQKRHLPIQTQMTRDTRQMTNSHRKKTGPSKVYASPSWGLGKWVQWKQKMKTFATVQLLFCELWNSLAKGRLCLLTHSDVNSCLSIAKLTHWKVIWVQNARQHDVGWKVFQLYSQTGEG